MGRENWGQKELPYSGLQSASLLVGAASLLCAASTRVPRPWVPAMSTSHWGTGSWVSFPP